MIKAEAENMELHFPKFRLKPIQGGIEKQSYRESY